MIPGSLIGQLFNQPDDPGTELKQPLLQIVGPLAFFQHFPTLPKLDVQRSTFDVQRSMFDVGRSMFKVQRSMFDVHSLTFEVGRFKAGP